MRVVFRAAILTTLACMHSSWRAFPQQVTTHVIEGQVLRMGNEVGIANLQVILSLPNPSLPSTPEAQAAADSAAFSIQSAKDSPLPNRGSYPTADRERAEELPPGSLTPAFLVSTRTDNAGHFAFKDLVPGRYTIQVNGSGEFSIAANGSPTMIPREYVLVETGKETPSLKIFMAQGGTISGVIRDASGRPLPNATVQTNQKLYFGGIAVLAMFRRETTTNDRGEYRLFGLPPGEYFVSAGVRPALGLAPLWQQTFFPGEVEPSRFLPIVLKGDGTEITGTSFSLRAAVPTTFTISGVAINPLPNAVRDPRTGEVVRSVSQFILVPHKTDSLNGLDAGALMATNSLSADARAHGEFVIRNVRPGVYDLYALHTDTRTGRAFGSRRTTIDVRSDIKDVSLVIEPGVPFAAEIVIEGPNRSGIKLEAVRLSILRPVDDRPFRLAGAGVRDLPFDSDGRVAIADAVQGRYSSTISGMPKSWYVSDIRQGGVSVWKSGFVVERNGSHVQFVVNTEGKTISGTVRFTEKKARRIVVVLMPPADERMNLDRFKYTNAGDDGRFSFYGIRPGTYALYAWENPPDINPWMNTEFVARSDGHGKPIIVPAGGAIDPLELDLIPTDAR